MIPWQDLWCNLRSYLKPINVKHIKKVLKHVRIPTLPGSRGDLGTVAFLAAASTLCSIPNSNQSSLYPLIVLQTLLHLSSTNSTTSFLAQFGPRSTLADTAASLRMAHRLLPPWSEALGSSFVFSTARSGYVLAPIASQRLLSTTLRHSKFLKPGVKRDELMIQLVEAWAFGLEWAIAMAVREKTSPFGKYLSLFLSFNIFEAFEADRPPSTTA